MESKYLVVGAIVEFRTTGSSATVHNVTVLEIHYFGFVGVQKGIKNAPVRLYPWQELSNFVFTPAVPVASQTRTSGAR